MKALSGNLCFNNLICPKTLSSTSNDSKFIRSRSKFLKAFQINILNGSRAPIS
jgi:hypothetical protein